MNMGILSSIYVLYKIYENKKNISVSVPNKK